MRDVDSRRDAEDEPTNHLQMLVPYIHIKAAMSFLPTSGLPLVCSCSIKPSSPFLQS
jgi:hypothetical protein